MMPKGLTDKLYWRDFYGTGIYHCYRKTGQQQFVSLCHLKDGELKQIGGQKCNRPRPLQRCPRCDVAEMKRRGWEESGPDSPNSV